MPDDKYERLVGRPRQEKAKIVKDKNLALQTEEEKNLNNITLDANDRIETITGGLSQIGFDQKESKATLKIKDKRIKEPLNTFPSLYTTEDSKSIT